MDKTFIPPIYTEKLTRKSIKEYKLAFTKQRLPRKKKKAIKKALIAFEGACNKFLHSFENIKAPVIDVIQDPNDKDAFKTSFTVPGYFQL